MADPAASGKPAGKGRRGRAAARPSLKARAIRWLAQREHSRLELRRKLLPWAAAELAESSDGEGRPAAGAGAADPSSTAAQAGTLPLFQAAIEARTSRRAAVAPEAAARVDALLDWLEAQGLLSDARFVESRVRVRASRMGTLRIRQELARHGAELSPEAARELKAGEPARALEAWQRKFGEPAEDAAGRARQMRFLAARGFDTEVVRRVVPAPRRRDESAGEDDE